jgi:hypothetical protein
MGNLARLLIADTAWLLSLGWLDNTLWHQPEAAGLNAAAEGFRRLAFSNDHEQYSRVDCLRRVVQVLPGNGEAWEAERRLQRYSLKSGRQSFKLHLQSIYLCK